MKVGDPQICRIEFHPTALEAFSFIVESLVSLVCWFLLVCLTGACHRKGTYTMHCTFPLASW